MLTYVDKGHDNTFDCRLIDTFVHTITKKCADKNTNLIYTVDKPMDLFE